MLRFISFIYRELFARKCTRCTSASLLARKLLFGLGLSCSKNRWLVADHALEQGIAINTVIRDKSCARRIKAGISLRKLCVEWCQWRPSLAVVLQS